MTDERPDALITNPTNIDTTNTVESLTRQLAQARRDVANTTSLLNRRKAQLDHAHDWRYECELEMIAVRKELAEAKDYIADLEGRRRFVTTQLVAAVNKSDASQLQHDPGIDPYGNVVIETASQVGNERVAETPPVTSVTIRKVNELNSSLRAAVAERNAREGR